MTEKDADSFRGSGHMLGVGTSFLAECAVFTALGWWLDSKFGTNPWLLVTGIMLGFGYATWNLLRQFGGATEGSAVKKGDDG